MRPLAGIEGLEIKVALILHCQFVELARRCTPVAVCGICSVVIEIAQVTHQKYTLPIRKSLNCLKYLKRNDFSRRR